MSFLTEFKDKKIVVLGAGMTGLSCLRFLHSQGLSFAINDSRKMPFASEEILGQYNKDYPEVSFVLGQWQQELLANADMRLGFDRRVFIYSDYGPERRFQEDRRSGFDQRPKQRLSLTSKEIARVSD